MKMRPACRLIISGLEVPAFEQGKRGISEFCRLNPENVSSWAQKEPF
jgi:hypothetical protein